MELDPKNRRAVFWRCSLKLALMLTRASRASSSPSNDSRPQVNTGGHILSFTPDSNSTAASGKQRPDTASLHGTRHPNPRSGSFTSSGQNYRLQKHETSAYLHMIRHFSPFHAPLTPPLMGKETQQRPPSATPGSAAQSLQPNSDRTSLRLLRRDKREDDLKADEALSSSALVVSVCAATSGCIWYI